MNITEHSNTTRKPLKFDKHLEGRRQNTSQIMKPERILTTERTKDLIDIAGHSELAKSLLVSVPEQKVISEQIAFGHGQAYQDYIQFVPLRTGVLNSNPWEGVSPIEIFPIIQFYFTPTGAVPIVQNLSIPGLLVETKKLSENFLKQTSDHCTPYMKRNVYKSIIRAMLRYIRNNRNEITRVLQMNNFDMDMIDRAFTEIDDLNMKDEIWKNPKKSQAALYSMISKKEPCTYILKETINSIMNNWTRGFVGRVSKNNITIYKEVYQEFYNQALKTLNYHA